MPGAGRPRLANVRLSLHLRGQMLVIVALSLAVLLGAVGLAVDGGRLFLERREAQGAADHAALSAAHAECSGSGADPIDAALAAAARNGYDNDGLTNSVVVTEEGSDPHRFHARVWSAVGTTFMRVLHFTTMDVTAEAVAGCAAGGGPGPGAIFAGGDNCTGGKYSFDVSGSTSRVYGGIYARSDVNIGGGTNQFTNSPTPPIDTFTYSGSLNPSLGSILSNGNTFEAPNPTSVPAPSPMWPAGWAPTDVTGGGSAPPAADSFHRAFYDLADANGTTSANDTLFTDKVESITKDGVYYTTHSDGMAISSITGSVRNVVLVAPNGPILISVSNQTLNAITDEQLDALPDIPIELDLPREGIVMLSGMTRSPAIKKCEEATIDVSGGHDTWNGIVWAPGGLIKMSGSDSTTHNGSLVGWAVQLAGSDLTIRYQDSGEAEPNGRVLIFK